MPATTNQEKPMANKTSKLIVAAVAGNISEVKALLAAKTPMPPSILQRTIFSGWAQMEDVTVLELLVEAGADVNSMADNTPLYSAAMVGPMPTRSLATTEFLLSHGADPNLPASGQCPLHLAVTTIADKTVKRLLDGGADVNAVSDGGETVTHLCVMALYEFVGDDFDPDDEEAKQDAWDTAEIYVMNVLEHVLAAKPDLSIANEDGETALGSVMLKNKYPERIVRALIDAGSPVNLGVQVSATERINLLTAAVVLGYSKDTVLQLLKKGNDPSLPYDALGGTAVSFAATREPDLAFALFDARPDLISALTPKGATMLHCAAFGGHVKLAEFLVAQGVDPVALTKEGQTALELSEEGNHEEVADLLRPHQEG